MPVVSYTTNGNGHLLVNPSGAHVPGNTVVTVEAVPYEDHPTPEPPDPPHPTPTIFDFIPLLFAKSKDWWRY